MQQKFGECKQCHKNRPINAKGNCSDCTYILNNRETRFEAQIRKQKDKPNNIHTFKRKPLKRTKIKLKSKKPTGEYEVFLEIWKEREHKCVNCKRNLDGFIDEETQNPSVMLFSHIKTKGVRVDLRLNKENIELLCPTCHYSHEHIGDEAYNNLKDKYKE